jgi:hypothetical protein
MSNAPLNNISSKYANIDNSHLGLFTSRNNSYSFGNPQIVNNVEAANASRYSGGRRRRKRKSKRKICLYKKKTNKRRKRRRTLRGGYNPYALINQNGGLSSVTNCNSGYSTGGVIPSNMLGLANPVPYELNK